ncbi:hypothetical protein V8E55_002585 [Tylopilus felleus]
MTTTCYCTSLTRQPREVLWDRWEGVGKSQLAHPFGSFRVAACCACYAVHSLLCPIVLNAVTNVFSPPTALDNSQLVPLPQLASWPFISMLRVRFDDALVFVIPGTFHIVLATVNNAFAVRIDLEDSDVEALFTSAILIHDNTPRNVSCLPIHSQLLLDRYRRLSLALKDVLKGVIQTSAGDRGIDPAIHREWPLCRSGST